MTHEFEQIDDSFSQSEELAADYTAGNMNASEREHFEALLDGGDQMLLDAFAAYSGVTEMLLNQIRPVAPDPTTRASLLDRIKSGSTSVEHSEDEPFIIRHANSGPWSETGIPGVTRHVLFEDHEQNRISVLMKLDPGATFPSHKHAQAEECLMLEGDLDFGAYSLKAGDYLRLAAGTEHGVARTKNGCICLVTAALVA